MEGHIASASGALGFTNAGVFALAFSDDGKTLVSGGNDSEVRLWDFLRRQSLGPGLADHSSPISSVVFGKDNMTVVSVDWRNNVIVHNVDPDSWRSPACMRANRNLTEEEWERYMAPDPFRATCLDLATGAGPAAVVVEE